MKNILSEKDTQAVYDILMHCLNVSADQITPEAKIGEELSADSLDKVQITMAVEERFEVRIPDEEAGNISTVQDLLEKLAAQLAKPVH